MTATLKRRTVVYFDPAEREALERFSKAYGTPIAALVRKAVRQWLQNEPRRLAQNAKALEKFAKTLGGEK